MSDRIAELEERGNHLLGELQKARAELDTARAALAERRLFPGLDGPSVPWAIIAPHEAQARRNHDQMLRRLAERGGLSASEMVAVLEDRKWTHMDDATAKARVLEIVRERHWQPKIDALEAQLSASHAEVERLKGNIAQAEANGQQTERERWQKSLGHDSPDAAWRHVNTERERAYQEAEADAQRREREAFVAGHCWYPEHPERDLGGATERELQTERDRRYPPETKEQP